MAQIRDCGLELQPHPGYFPALASSDFHLFPILKKPWWPEISLNKEVKVAVNQYFEVLEESFFKTCGLALESRWKNA